MSECGCGYVWVWLRVYGCVAVCCVRVGVSGGVRCVYVSVREWLCEVCVGFAVVYVVCMCVYV